MTSKLKYKYIGVDFDNTIAYDAHPNIGKLIPGAAETIRKIKEHGGKIVIWTCRTGKQAEKVKEFLKKNNIPYDKFNEAFDEHIEEYGGDSRKIYLDLQIDDKCILWQEKGKIVDWNIVNNILFKE